MALGFEILKDSKKYTKGEKTLLQIIPVPISGAESEGINVYMGWATSVWPQYNALSRELYPQLEGLLADGTIKVFGPFLPPSHADAGFAADEDRNRERWIQCVGGSIQDV